MSRVVCFVCLDACLEVCGAMRRKLFSPPVASDDSEARAHRRLPRPRWKIVPLCFLVGFGAMGCTSKRATDQSGVAFDLPSLGILNNHHDPKCAEIVLRPNPQPTLKNYAVPADSIPSVAVDLGRVPTTTEVRVELQSCNGNGATLARVFRRHLPFFVLGGEEDDDHDDDSGSMAKCKDGHNEHSDHEDGQHQGDDHHSSRDKRRADQERDARERAWSPHDWATSCRGSFSRSASCEHDSHDHDDHCQPAGPVDFSRCFRVVATAFSCNGQMTGAATAVVRRGDFAVSGDLQRPSGSQPGSAHLVVQVDQLRIPSEVDSGGHFKVEHLPAGTLVRIQAELSQGANNPPLTGDVAPLIVLNAAHPTATVAVPLGFSAFAMDAYEPDDTLADLSGRQPAANGIAQTHNLPSKQDADIVPVAVSAGTAYHVEVKPTGQRPADLQLTILDSNSSVLAHVNDTASDYQDVPTLNWLATLSGTVYARISRSDDEAIGAPYNVTVTW
jgi:hypothetical protein